MKKFQENWKSQLSSLNDSSIEISEVAELRLKEKLDQTSNSCLLSIRKLILAFWKNVGNRRRNVQPGRNQDILIKNLKELARTCYKKSKIFEDESLKNIFDPSKANEFKFDSNDEATIELILSKCIYFSTVVTEIMKVLYNEWTYGQVVYSFYMYGGYQNIINLIHWLA
jgi:hypothetical protein